MIKRNINFPKLQAGYLFPEINRRKKALLDKVPDAKIISLGIGNTTEPLSDHIRKGLSKSVDAMGTREGYSGYGNECGQTELREKISKVFYSGNIKADEIFVSDGSKCDIGRLQLLMGANRKFAVQDPSYPVYVDGGVLYGQTGNYNESNSQFEGITYMPCLPENGFFPDYTKAESSEVIYFCSPNNPTGNAATKEQLESLVKFAKEKKKVIIFDAAYSMFVSDPELPKSIYEIEGAREVAIETNSFSKPAGFTGVRLGWTIVPNELKYEDGSSVKADWTRVMTTIFNGASNIVQAGGIAALEPEGLKEIETQIAYYMNNAKLIKKTLSSIGLTVYGGDNAPYIWAEFPGRKSWDVFEEILNSCHVVTTPGSGFGPAGEGFVRFSAFGHKEDVEQACKRLEETLSK